MWSIADEENVKLFSVTEHNTSPSKRLRRRTGEDQGRRIKRPDACLTKPFGSAVDVWGWDFPRRDCNCTTLFPPESIELDTKHCVCTHMHIFQLLLGGDIVARIPRLVLHQNLWVPWLSMITWQTGDWLLFLPRLKVFRRKLSRNDLSRVSSNQS